MTCNNSANISFAFKNDDGDTVLEIRPREMQFNRTRGEFDYCKAEFSDDVAKHLQPQVDDEESVMRQPLPVLLKIEGNPIYRLLWVPEGARFTDGEVHIEFHDAQKYLTRGVVDWRRQNVKLQDAYDYVFSQRNTDGPQIFADIKYATEGENYEELVSLYEAENVGGDPQRTSDRALELDQEYGDGIGSVTDDIEEIERESVSNIIEGHYALDFDKLTPWECITRMNDKFGVTTWAAPDGNLWVGSRISTGVKHIATPDDDRVWKLSDYNVRPTRDPVVRSIIRGGWSDDPSEGAFEQRDELLNLNRGTKDFRIEGVASLDGSFLGQEIFEERIDAKRDNLEAIAKRKMMNKQREQSTGYVDIRPELSADTIRPVSQVTIGDMLWTIPPDADNDEDSMCDTNIKEEKFDIIGIQHELTGDGSWNLRLDVVKRLDGELHPDHIETNLRYYDPHEKDTIEGDNYSALQEQEEENGFWGNLF